MATKTEIVGAFAQEFDVTRAQAEAMCMKAMDLMYDFSLKEGYAVFGPHKFQKKVTAPRKGRNPQTGEAMDIPSKVKVQYKRLNR
jgi:nucleoid DNA-binding protein